MDGKGWDTVREWTKLEEKESGETERKGNDIMTS